jgi:hypothetical protein
LSDSASFFCTFDFGIRSTNQSGFPPTVPNEAGEHILAIG